MFFIVLIFKVLQCKNTDYLNFGNTVIRVFLCQDTKAVALQTGFPDAHKQSEISFLGFCPSFSNFAASNFTHDQ